MVLINETRGVALAGRVRLADTFWRRLVGLLTCKGLGAREGLLIAPCRAVHTHFMRFAIDVAFLDKDWRVVGVAPDLKPWRHAFGGESAWATLELPGGVLAETGTQVGDQLKMVE